MLKRIGTFIFDCKPGKTARNAAEVAKNALLAPFWTTLPKRGERGGVQTKYANFCDFSIVRFIMGKTTQREKSNKSGKNLILVKNRDTLSKRTLKWHL